MTPTEEGTYECQWTHCAQELFNTKDDWISHLSTHFYNQVGESCCNSPVQSPEPSLSSSPSTPTSNISSSSSSPPEIITTTMMSSNKTSTTVVDTSEIQGIALVAAHLLDWLSKDPSSMLHFIPYEKELTTIVEQRPKLASHILAICSNFTNSISKQANTNVTIADTLSIG